MIDLVCWLWEERKGVGRFMGWAGVTVAAAIGLGCVFALDFWLGMFTTAVFVALAGFAIRDFT